MSRSHRVRFIRRSATPEQIPPEGLAEVAFVGRSNVGKSSLINALLGIKGLARVSRTPGKTQQIDFFEIDRSFVFADLPGYGFAQVPEAVRRRWGPLVEGYLGSRKTLRLVVFLLDFRRIPSPQDLQLREWLRGRRVPVRFVLTKVDKLPRGQRGIQARKIADSLGTEVEHLTYCSAITKEGTRELWALLRNALDNPPPSCLNSASR
ncbi:MAG: ribosome biogenesis GTP-binding protein YihA/YsxC [Thermodesulfobacteriota bacterium]